MKYMSNLHFQFCLAEYVRNMQNELAYRKFMSYNDFVFLKVMSQINIKVFFASRAFVQHCYTLKLIDIYHFALFSRFRKYSIVFAIMPEIAQNKGLLFILTSTYNAIMLYKFSILQKLYRVLFLKHFSHIAIYLIMLLLLRKTKMFQWIYKFGKMVNYLTTLK